METKRLTIPAAEELLGLYFPVLDHEIERFTKGSSG